MRVFLGWSGERSRAIASALREWLPDVLHLVKPWMSDIDIYAGQRWGAEIQTVLGEATCGILCVTPENRNSPWLLFEAGALSRAAVIPLLLDVAATDISTGPLGQFQAKKLDQDGCYGLLAAINTRLETPVETTRLRRAFERWWPDLEERINRIPAAAGSDRKVQEMRISAGVPITTLRNAAAHAREKSSLRAVAREAGITPMGLRYFILGEGTPHRNMVRKLNDWYVLSGGDTRGGAEENE